MTPRRRLVAPLAAACLTTATLVLAPAAAHADPRTLRLVSTGTPEPASFAGLAGSTVLFSSGGDLYREGSTTPLAAGASLLQASATQALVRQNNAIRRVDLTTGVPTEIAPAGSLFGAATADLSRVAYEYDDEVYVTGVGALPTPGSGPASFAGADSSLTTVYVARGGNLYRGTKSFGDAQLRDVSSDGETGYVDTPDGLFRLAGGSLVEQPGYGFGGMSGDGRTAYLVQGDAIYRQVDGGTPALVATGFVEGVTANGTLIWSDGDGRLHRSTGPGSDEVVSGALTGSLTFGGQSSDGRVFFTRGIETADETAYVYESGAVTTLGAGAVAAIAPDSNRAYLDSAQALTAADTDAERDVYESALTPPVVPPTTPPAPADTTPPAAEVDGKKKQVLDKALEVSVTCGTTEPCLVTGTGTLKVRVPAARGNQKFRLKAKGASVAAGAERVIAFKVSGKARKAARAAFKRGGSAKAKLKVTVRDAAGNERVIAFRVIAFRVIAFRQG